VLQDVTGTSSLEHSGSTGQEAEVFSRTAAAIFGAFISPGDALAYWYATCIIVRMMQIPPEVCLPTRQVMAADTQITVVEAEGKLFAIVKDHLRGTVRVTLGAVRPVSRRACAD